MEEELKCSVCKQFLSNAVLLPCCHAICLNCSLTEQRPVDSLQENSGNSSSSSTTTLTSISNTSSSFDNNNIALNYDTDKQSVSSETDSGVVCNSRPNSYIAINSFQGVSISSVDTSKFVVFCPSCHQVVYLDENGSFNLPKYRAMQNIIDKYTNNTVQKCHLCVTEPPSDATVFCEQCEVLYCDDCREKCHPTRGPLAKHVLLSFSSVKNIQICKLKKKTYQCLEHNEESVSLYCTVCKIAVCALCIRDSQHIGHDVQSMNAICKEQKLELKQRLQQLSIKARNLAENLSKLRNMNGEIDENCMELEGQMVAQCDNIIEMVNRKKLQLVDSVRQQRDAKKKVITDQVTDSSHKLQRSTAFLQFAFELIKEPDPAAFLQVGSALMNRISNVETAWHKDIDIVPKVSRQFDLSLDLKSILKSIENLNFVQMRVPDAPIIIPEECNTENNTVTVAWQVPESSYVTGYLLELDDGCAGTFKEVYCGKETICTVDGLRFGCIYRARVKAYNDCGDGQYSETIGLQTTDVAWFILEPCLSSRDMCFSSDNATITCEGFEHRVSLGNIAFSNGVHYWQFSIDRYDSDTDPSFGIAIADVSKDLMLGKDNKGWAMYIDRKRSWFMHNNVHKNRHDGGITVGCTVGILLDLIKHQLSFYVNQEPQGQIAFNDLYGVFYPAVSINRGVTVTLHTALDPPSDYEEN